jgi:hypothetical protein
MFYDLFLAWNHVSILSKVLATCQQIKHYHAMIFYLAKNLGI